MLLKIVSNPFEAIIAAQKCTIPFEFCPKGCVPGSLAKCTLSPSGNQVICRIIPKVYKKPVRECYLDTTVMISNTNSLDNNFDSFIEKIETIIETIENIESLQVVVTLNDISSIKLTMDTLQQIILEILKPLQICQGSRIRTDSVAKVLGIATVDILLSNPANCTNVNSSTKLTIKDVQLQPKYIIPLQKLSGMENLLHELFKIKDQLKNREKLTAWKLKPSCNALIIGSVGSGKTSLCHNFISECNANYKVIKSSDIIGQYPGETEELLRKNFNDIENFVRVFQPINITVILIEDIDLICPAVDREKNDVAHVTRISNQLMSLMDEFHGKMLPCIILATTSNIEALNAAVRRPGRLEKEIYINIPNQEQRHAILKSIAHNFDFGDQNQQLHLKEVAKLTAGYTGGDLNVLCKNAARIHAKNRALILLQAFHEALKFTQPTSQRGADVTIIKTDQTFETIGGMEKLKNILNISVLGPLKHPEAFERFGIPTLKGILLYGPPGCAKTTIAKCLAKEANMTLIVTSGAEIFSPYVGNAEKFICKIFNNARKNLPCLIFLDEIDSLVGCREKSSKSDVQTRVLSTLLTEMDGIGIKLQQSTFSTQMDSQILVVAATNRPDMIDNALMRPGRFDKLIHVTAPDFQSRLEIFKIYQKKMPFSKDICLEDLTRKTDNFSGADLCNLCNEASMAAFTRDFNTSEVISNDFEQVLKTLKPSLTLKQIEWYFNFEKNHTCL